jgi:hypothetical protein
MKNVKGLDRHELLERGINALYKELGPAEARRFISLTQPVEREDSVARHRRWQGRLKKSEFISRMRTAYKKARTK